MSVVAHKHYLADKKPFYKHFQSRDITITAVRSVAMQGLMVFNGFIASLELEESDGEDDTDTDEDADDDLDAVMDKLKKRAAKKTAKDGEEKKKDEFTPPTANEFGIACATSFTKSLSITTCLRILEEIAIAYLRPQVVGKLVKDVSKSATRKFLRTHSRFTAGALIVKTGMRSNILGHISIFLVEEAHQVILILVRRYKASKKAGEKKHLRNGDHEKDEKKDELDVSAASFLRITAKNARRSGLAVLTGGLGAAVGTIIRPGLGTVIGATLGDTIAYVI